MITLTYGIDAIHPNDNSEYVNLGMELNYSDKFFLRGGIPSLLKKDRIEGLSFGVGINYPINRMRTLLKIDYSLSNFGPLGEVRRLNLSFNF